MNPASRPGPATHSQAAHSEPPGQRRGVLRKADVGALRTAAGRFGPVAEDAKASLLGRAAKCAPGGVRTLAAYHDALLFLIAYPGSIAVLEAARREIARVARAACTLARDDRHALERTGIAGCEVTASFSHALCEWLSRHHRARAELTGFGEEERVADILALCLPRMETEITAAARDPLALLDDLRGARATRMQWLLSALRRIRASEEVRAHLFESMQPFVTIRPEASSLSRTFARGLDRAPWLHAAPLEKHVADPAAQIRAPLPGPVALSPADQRALVDAARASLAMLARETDPITWPSRPGVTLYDLGRGASVALYPMAPSRRFALDSHTGYLMLKNGVPVGYGGGWPFAATCRTGTNIFSAFRGGESSWLFVQVLRAYRQHFGVKRFLVEPYQFGAGNREGLLSGAFWFYYRLGFRPVERDVARIAAAESPRLSRSGYRTPLPTMRALAASDLALDLAPTSAAERCEPAEISLAVSRWIARMHAGDRGAACADAGRRVSRALRVTDASRWPRDEREAFRSLSLAFGLIRGLEDWSADEKARTVELMRAKGRPDDAPFFRALAAHPRLLAGLARVAAGGR